MTESLANQSIEAAGLKVSVKYETSSKASYGTVTSQTPYSGGDTVVWNNYNYICKPLYKLNNFYYSIRFRQQ